MKKVEVRVDTSLLKDLVVGNTLFRSSLDYHLTAKDVEKAREVLKETEEKITTGLKELKKMLSKEKRMRYRMDDDYLLRFLRVRKFDVQKTYKFIKNFYTVRNEDPLLFTLHSDLESKFKGEFINLMPYTNESGEMVVLVRMSHWNPPVLSVRDFCVVDANIADVISMNPHMKIDGVIEFLDFGGVTAGQLSELIHPSAIKLYAKLLQDLYPWRVKKVIVFNVNAVIYASLCIIRYFMKKKISDRVIVIRSDFKELHKHVSPEILPKSYGGKLDDEESYSFLKNFIYSNKEYIRYENSFIGYNK